MRNELNRNKFYVHLPLCVLFFLSSVVDVVAVVVAVSFVMVLISSHIQVVEVLAVECRRITQQLVFKSNRTELC